MRRPSLAVADNCNLADRADARKPASVRLFVSLGVAIWQQPLGTCIAVLEPVGVTATVRCCFVCFPDCDQFADATDERGRAECTPDSAEPVAWVAARTFTARYRALVSHRESWIRERR